MSDSMKQNNSRAECTVSDTMNSRLFLGQNSSQIKRISGQGRGLGPSNKPCPKVYYEIYHNSQQHVTSLQSRPRSDLPRGQPVTQRKQTGLSESRRIRAETCSVEGKRGSSEWEPVLPVQTLSPPGISGLCGLDAGAC